MYKNIEDFIIDWEIEAKSTLKIFSAISSNMIGKKVNENVRSLGKLAWHITQTLTEMPEKAKIIPKDILENNPVPEKFEIISDIYTKHSKELIVLLKENWKGLDLNSDLDMYGQQWKRNKVLTVLIRHQVHHRAQMTVIMRLVDIKVPGIYGPAKEEWAQFGMETQE